MADGGGSARPRRASLARPVARLDAAAQAKAECPLPMWIRPESEEVLLQVKIRPFLSHKRENARTVAQLKGDLKLYGAGGWKDTDDLRLGTPAAEEIRRAIFEETGGFLWWGTGKALGSKIINGLEIPTALERAQREPGYPLVPVFVDVAPAEAGKKLAHRIGKENAQKFVDRNGLTRGSRERLDDLRVRATRRYVRDAVASLPMGDITVAFRALSEPNGEHDLTFDWRAVIDPRARLLEDEILPVLLDALANTREAFQARVHTPQLLLDTDLPLPLAFLLGYEWRATTRIRLRIGQRTGASFSWIGHEGTLSEEPRPVRRRLGGDGPAVVAVSCKDPLEKVALRYAEKVNASELVLLHVPGLLDAAGLRALTRAGAGQLRELNNRALAKHLLIRGPGALAVMCGAESNAAGPVVLPFWDGAKYVSPLVTTG